MVMKQEEFQIQVQDAKTNEHFDLHFFPLDQPQDRPLAPTLFEVSLKNVVRGTLGTMTVNFDRLLAFRKDLDLCLDHFRK